MKSRPPQNSFLFQFLQLIQLAGKESDSRALKALKLLQLDESHQKSPFVQSVKKELTQTIAANSTAGENPNPYRHRINHEDAHGPLELGQVIYDFNQPMSNQPVYSLYPIELTCPNLIAGGTGSGKTNILYVLASEIHRFNQTYGLKEDDRIGMFFFQTMKLDEDYLYNINDEIIFLDSDTLKINPLWHEGHNREIVFQRFTKLAGEVFFFREGSANQVSTLLEKLDKQHNGRPFSVYELYEEIKKLPRTRYEGVLENRFAGLLSNKSGKIFDCLKGLPLEKLAHEFVIINLTDLDYYSQEFICLNIYQYLTEVYKRK